MRYKGNEGECSDGESTILNQLLLARGFLRHPERHHLLLEQLRVAAAI